MEENGASWNQFRFWKIKGLNEKLSESRLIEFEKMQDKDVMSLGDEDWSLWSKKEGMWTWIMRHEANSSKLAWKFGT